MNLFRLRSKVFFTVIFVCSIFPLTAIFGIENPVDPYGFKLGRPFAKGKTINPVNNDVWGSWYAYPATAKPAFMPNIQITFGYFLRIYTNQGNHIIVSAPIESTKDGMVSHTWEEYLTTALGSHINRTSSGTESSEYWKQLYAAKMRLNQDILQAVASGKKKVDGNYIYTYERIGASGVGEWREIRDNWHQATFTIDEIDQEIVQSTISAVKASQGVHGSVWQSSGPVHQPNPRQAVVSSSPQTTGRALFEGKLDKGSKISMVLDLREGNWSFVEGSVEGMGKISGPEGLSLIGVNTVDFFVGSAQLEGYFDTPPAPSDKKVSGYIILGVNPKTKKPIHSKFSASRR